MKQFNAFLLFSVFMLFSCSDNVESTKEISDHQVEKRQFLHEDGPGWTPCEIANLKIFVPENCNETYTQGFTDAATNYNNIPNSGINIEIVSDEDEADIIVSCYNSPNSTTGGSVGSDLDDDGKSTKIFMNNSLDLTLFDCPQSEVDLCGATGLIMHEMFHAIGFYHDGDDNCHAELVEGTPENDPNSAIVAGPDLDWCNLTCEFSEFDILALQTAYPCGCSPLRRKKGRGFFCTIGEVKTFCAPSNIDISEWEIPSNLNVISTEDNCITVQVNQLNKTTNLIAHLDNNSCGYNYTFEINTLETPNFDISWNDPVCLGDVVTFTINPLPSSQTLSVIGWNVVGGKLALMSSNSNHAVAEALSPGTTTICATVKNKCGNTHEYCRIVTIKPNSECREDGELPNPK